MSAASAHVPVLQTTVLAILSLQKGEKVLDATLGLGGHAQSFLEAIGSNGHLIGLDADESNLAIARERLQPLRSQTQLIHANFASIAQMDIAPIDILFADLGLSSPHLDDPERGFTFRAQGPLDLRYDRTQGKTAADIIRESDEEQLAEIFRIYGELYPQARRLGSLLAGQELATTIQLRSLVEQGFGFRAKAMLPQVFQALRIAVNDELIALGNLLATGPKLLNSNGRMGIISYHSLEDRMVKHMFRSLTQAEKDPLTGKKIGSPEYTLLTPKAVVPSEMEIAKNPRARSAKFRAIQRS